MSQLKLNLLRVRLSGPYTFRFAGPSLSFSLAAFGSSSISSSPLDESYSADDLRSLARFAASRGVSLVPDLGLSGPVGPGWDFYGDLEEIFQEVESCGESRSQRCGKIKMVRKIHQNM